MSVSRNKVVQALLVVGVIALLTGCAAGTEEYSSANEAGFFSGIWHGWIAPIAILWHFLFDNEVRIYEVDNNGIAYDIGFYVAVISGFGSLALTRKPKKS